MISIFNLFVRLIVLLFIYLRKQHKYSMESIDLWKKTVKELKNHVDCLLIRVTSCEQFIEKIFKVLS